METLKTDHTALMTEHKSVYSCMHGSSLCVQRKSYVVLLLLCVVCVRTLQEVHRSVVVERDRLSTSLKHIRGTATPRPEWSRCEGYVEEWAESSQGLSSDQLVDVLLAELSGKTLEEITAHSAFQGQVGGS